MAVARGRPAKPSLLVDEAWVDCDGALCGVGDGDFRFSGREGVILDVWDKVVSDGCGGICLPAEDIEG